MNSLFDQNINLCIDGLIAIYIVFCRYATSSSEDESGAESDGSEGSHSSTSYDEGSYDGRQGSITYTCKDDEAIAQGAPGARMFDQNIRET